MSVLHSIYLLHNSTLCPSHLRNDLNQEVVTCPKITLLFLPGYLGMFLFFFLWFHFYRLRYLLRLSCVVFILAFLLHTLPHEQVKRWCNTWAATFCDKSTIQSALSVYTVAMVVMLVIRYHWGLPFNIIRYPMGDAVYQWHNRVRSRRTARNQMQGNQDELPPVYPNGWIPIAESNRVSLGSVISVSAIGQKFCVFRGMQGRVYVLDAFCPHLGADMTVEGRVRGECIECPFHGWEFAGEDGQCQRIPYAQTVPSVAKTKAWISCERNAFIFVWHHAEGEEPSWDIPLIHGVESGEWKYRGRTQHVVHCHIQEIPENGADVAHLHQLHSRSIFLGSNWMDRHLLLDFVAHEWHPDWRPDDDRRHVGRIQLSQSMTLFGLKLPGSKLHMDIEQIGPATVHLHLRSWFGRGVLVQHITPEGPLTQKVVHLLFTESGFKQFPADLLVLAEAIMFDRDVSVWNHKILLRNPILVREDRLIRRYRRWYSQFYSEHSPTLQDIRDRTLDW